MDRLQHLVYTTEVGGLLQFGDPGQFEKAKETGELDVTPPWIDSPHRTFVSPKYIALLEVVDDFDFILGRARTA